MSMIGISIILLIKATYGNYTLAGLVSAVNIIATALVAPTLSRLVDQYGQTKIMVPSLIISVASVSGMLAVALLHAYPGLVCLFAALAGATWGSPSALVYGSRTWQAPMWKLYAIGVFALAIGSSTYLLAHSLPVMAVIMLIAGVACAPTMTNVNMIVARVVPSESLTEGLTWMSTSLNLGLSIGSALAGPAVDARGSHGGYLFMVVAAWLMVLVMLAGLKIVRNATSGATSTAEVAPVPGESNTPSASGHATQEQDADGQ